MKEQQGPKRHGSESVGEEGSASPDSVLAAEIRRLLRGDAAEATRGAEMIQVPPSNEEREAFDKLRAMADASVADHVGMFKPTWAPPLAVAGELAAVVRELGWLSPQDADVVRLWATWARLDDRYVCAGFELRAGTKKRNQLFFTATCPLAGWKMGPEWVKPPPSHPTASRYLPHVRATSLGRQRACDFARNPNEELRAGAVLAGICAICGRTLTDPVSIGHGIGPECLEKLAVILSVMNGA